jgi:photosystem II stability/assembly factor-like uncharacterized protein
MHALASLVIRSRAVFFLLPLFLPFFAGSQQVDPRLYDGLRWRMIGPFRGGRSIAVSGVEGRPEVYYFGAVAGGVWKTTNGGVTWEPIFDSQPIASIGALAVAHSNPDVIYVGTGEADFRSDLTYGNGIYKSGDGGRSWSHIGLVNSGHIARILIDPGNPDVVVVAALGDAYAGNRERGIFRSGDGGASWQNVLSKGPDIGAVDLAADPDNPQTIYAALLNDRRPPWTTYPPSTTSGAIYKSTDGGLNWQPMTGGGLPGGDWGRVGLAVARGTRGQRVYALVDTKEGGLFRSDDAGQSWTLVSSKDPRVRQRLWYFGEVAVDPKDPDTVYLPNVSLFRSHDGGRNFEALKGAPGGDDYHSLWIDPANPRRMIFGSDQGVGISVDGGGSWSSWYNQPTAQIYHVAVDNQFPYHVYGAQQDSGSVETTSRGNDGSITFRDWHPVGAGESGYIAPDPTDPNIVYGGGTYGELFRYDKRTGQAENIAPEAIRNFGRDPAKAEYRFTWTSPLVFSPQDSHTLYFGAQYVLKSTDQGNSWQKISPDLTGTDPNASRQGSLTPEGAKARGHGVVYTIAPSPVDARVIWAGSDTGLIHVTRDAGKTWRNITPSSFIAYTKPSFIEASHFDVGTAYTAVDRHRLGDVGAEIVMTRDFGISWKRINAGIPDGAYVRVVREDPQRKGLLFAGTELGVYFSRDDGDHWQPLRLNMPVVPVHDLVIKDGDLVAATHGRSFWILDDISPLRQMSSEIEGASAYLFKPATAMRIRASTNHDTPLPPEVPAGENPPPGAIFYYYLKSRAQAEVNLEVLDAGGKLVRAYSSNDKPSSAAQPPPFPSYWLRPPGRLSAAEGMHRFLWDGRYAPPPTRNPGYSMSTVFGRSVPLEPEGAQALPGRYQVRLSVDGKVVSTQPFELVMDPRVKATAEDLSRQFELEDRLSQALETAEKAIDEIHAARAAARISEEQESRIVGRRNPGGLEEEQAGSTLTSITGSLRQLMTDVDSADAAPTIQEARAAEATLAELKTVLAMWEKMKR